MKISVSRGLFNACNYYYKQSSPGEVWTNNGQCMDKMQTISFSSMNKNNFAVRFIHRLTLPVTPVLKKISNRL